MVENSSPTRDLVTLVSQVRSPGAAAGGFVAALSLGAMAVALGLDPGLTPATRGLVASLGGLLALALLVTSWRLAVPRGGLVWDGAGRRLGLGLTGTRDTWWIPIDRVASVRLHATDFVRDGESIRWWTACLLLADGVPLVLSEDTEHHLAHGVAARVSEVIGVPVVEEAPPEADTLGPAAGRIAVHHGAALVGVYLVLGASLLCIGTALFVHLERFPVVGLFVAPVMALLGAIFLAIVGVKRFAVEEVERSASGVWSHRFRVGRFRLGERTVRGGTPRWRIRLGSLRGACLELVAEEGTLVVGSGATTHSRAGVEDLVAFPRLIDPA